MASITLHGIDPSLKSVALAFIKQHGVASSHIISAIWVSDFNIPS
jgi:hypothetical protein